MKPEERRHLLLVALPAAALAAWMVAVLVLVWVTFDAAERAAVGDVLQPRAMLLVLCWLVTAAAASFGMRWLHTRHVAAPGRLLERTRALLGRAAPPREPVDAEGDATLKALSGAIDELARQRDALRVEIDDKVREASRDIEQERNRLAALMSELTESVVVCNLEGRILLYNARARVLFRALSRTPQLAGGAELIGIGRSIHAAFDKRLVDHALEQIGRHLERGEASPSAQFVTSGPGGQLIRVQMAPVRGAAGGARPSADLAGYVLMLADITREFEQESLRDQLMHGLTEGSRASLANLQAAVEMLEYPDLDAPMREGFLRVIREEVGAMSLRIKTLADDATQGLKTRWPLQDMLGADLVSAALRRIEATPKAPRAGASEVDASLWLKVDSFSLMQSLAYLALRLADEFEVRSVQLRLSGAGGRARLDLVWAGQAMSTETVMSWQMDAMRIGQDSTPLTVRDVVERHGGEFWFERERVRHEAFFRFLLPLATPQPAVAAPQPGAVDERPEYYDFDLFRSTEQTRELDERLLSELSYTVFDTETTGLNPSEGDEIIQIGATRIVNGKLRRAESFDQLVDPRRPIPAASIPIHGITPEMVAGKPTAQQVLPALHAFAQDTVLVAHNAAFDMRFLQMKEQATGVRFDHPVLDTLLLSALLQPNQESHTLEAIARRFGIEVTGRHTALGDALVTAEVFLHLLPLLQASGIRTLGQAREAAERTYYARLQY